MTDPSNVLDLYARSVERFQAAVEGVPGDGWDAVTPCTDWNMRQLVNHLVGEDRWVVPLVEGKTIAEVGDELDGDVLGDAPSEASSAAGKAAVAAFAEPGALGRTVHLSFGDFTAEDYAWQVLVDHVVHTWDVLAGAGSDRTLDPALVAAATGFWEQWAEPYRQSGAVAPPVEVPDNASAQDKLIASFGRDPAWSA
jgi:uncharacterized protein (TIGR03086 family)